MRRPARGAPPRRSATFYGPNVAALLAYVLTFGHLPVERAALLVKDLTGARPSAAYVH